MVKLRLGWHVFVAFCRGLNFLRLRRERLRQERLEELALHHDLVREMAAQNALAIQAFSRAIEVNASASTASAEVLKKWVESFQTTALPYSHTVTEADETEWWLEKQRGDSPTTPLPDDFLSQSEEYKLQWILRHSKDEDN